MSGKKVPLVKGSNMVKSKTVHPKVSEERSNDIISNKFCALDEDDDNMAKTQKQLLRDNSNNNKKVVLSSNTVDSTDNANDWITCDKVKGKPKKVHTQNIEDVNDIGTNYKLKSKWNVWVHKSESNNWSPSSYKVVYTIEDLSSFWRFFNNISELDLNTYQFYVMRDTSCPTWEHESNRHGGTCSIRLSRDKMNDVLEQISVLVLNESFNDVPEEINGVSFGVKINWGLIKIWNNNCDHDISGFVPNYMIKKYAATPRYKKNEPEY